MQHHGIFTAFQERDREEMRAQMAEQKREFQERQAVAAAARAKAQAQLYGSPAAAHDGYDAGIPKFAGPSHKAGAAAVNAGRQRQQQQPRRQWSPLRVSESDADEAMSRDEPQRAQRQASNPGNDELTAMQRYLL